MALSAQDFIRALRAPSDPPQPGGPAKIQVARDVWDNHSLYVPNKGEAIVEWSLGRLLKDKDREASTNPILDERYWLLLRDVLVDSGTAKLRPVRAWLVPILQRTPLAPVVIATLASWVKHASSISSAHAHASSECLSALWPLAVAKFSAEVLLDCFAAVNQLFTGYPNIQQSFEPTVRPRFGFLCQQILGSYRHALANASNKKKLFSSFTQQHLQSWIRCIGSEDGVSSLASEDVYAAGVETMLNVDILRQAQDRDDAVLLELLSKVMASDPISLCWCLPRLLGSYIEAARKHRAALFGQSSHQAAGSSADQARIASLKFAATCDTISGHVSDLDIRWQTRARILQILDSEALYGTTNEPVMDVLRRSGEEAITLLAEAIQEGHSQRVEYTLMVLATVTHIDYDLMSHSIPRILPLLLATSSPSMSASTYLQHILDYHSKTRTMDSLVETVLVACEPQTANGIQIPPSSAHRSPIFQHEFSDNLARCLTSFITPGQVTGTVDSVLRYLRKHLVALEASSLRSEDDTGKPQKKKRKVDSPSTTVSSELSPTAVAFSLTSRIASIVLSSVPSRYLVDVTERHVTETVQEFYNTTRSTLKDILKKIKRSSEGTAQHLQSIATLVIRLRYSIRTTPAFHVSTESDAKISSKLLSALSSVTLPSFRVQILRTLLSDVDLTHCESSPVFDEILDLVDGQPLDDSCEWNGSVDDIHNNAQAVIAVCHLVFERWLPLFDAAATPKQLARLANLLTSPHLATQFSATRARHLGFYSILQRALHNAEIWELQRFRDALLERINEVTNVLDSIKLDAALEPASKLSAESSSSIAATYRLLLCIPTEYLTRNTRNDLVRRALTADVVFAESPAPLSGHASLFFREFLRRLFHFMGSVEHATMGPYLAFLIQKTPAAPSPALTFTTSELVKMHMVACVKLSTKGDHAILQDVIKYYTAFVANQVSIEGQHQQQLAWLGLIHVIDAIANEIKPAELGPAVVDQFKALHQRLSTTLIPHITSLSSRELEGDDALSWTLLLELWQHCLVLQRWLSTEDHLPSFSTVVVARLMRSMPALDSSSYPLYAAAASIAQEECRSSLSTQSSDGLDVVLASHLVFYRVCAQPGKEALDELLSKFLKSIPTTAFSYMLDQVSEGLSAAGLNPLDLANLVQVYTVLLQNAPEGSSKILQSSWSRCLQLFSARPEILENSHTRLAVLRSISRQFNDKSALVRQLDLSSLWSILGSCLEGSRHHDSSTDKATFHETISTINALIRLRRNLVTATLPHLSHVLRRLLLSLRHLRPQLGAKQRKMVTDTLPIWVNASQPLTPEESKALARLLTTMTTKTIVRGHMSAPDAGKAESLARPFSKHAAYVLQAYIEALNDPLCIIPADMRKELEPGLFALCDMMGEYNRDALMVASLDAGGKTVLKSIWREYEKQKYIGKG